MNRFALLALLPLSLAACLFPMSRRDIEAANQQHYARMCGDPQYAYETGYNHGLERKRLDTSWVDISCMPDQRMGVRASYQGGYENGMQHAPIVVRGVGGGGGYGYSYGGGETCTFSSDCGEGRSCRQNAQGTNVCMGGGYAGDACWFSSDCVSNSCDGSSKVCK